MHYHRIGWTFSIVLFLAMGFAAPAYPSVPAKGEFIAGKSCEAYQSMRRRTNPGHVQLEVGRSYEIIELNVPSRTTWFRLRVEEASPSERWAYFECGEARVTSRGHGDSGDGQPGGGGQCNTAGQEDSYVFAVSWQPAFCESHQDKPECGVDDPSVYQANNFTLHGLWPNKSACGTGYGFCGQPDRPTRPFCNYPPVPMQAETLDALGRVMPSAAHHSCLQRHEWYKHGTCQTEFDADGYFKTAMRLLEEFNNGGMAEFMQQNIGRTVDTQSFFDAMDQAFHGGAHQRLQISCKDGKLVDVYINLPADLPNDASLASLLRQAEPKHRNACGQRFEVDAIGQ